MGGIVGAPVGRVAYSPQEAAALLGVSRATIWADIKSGAIPSTKLGGRRLIPAWAVADLVPGKQPSDHFALEDVAELLGMETDALRQVAGDGPFTRAWFRTHLLAGLETKSGAVWDVISSADTLTRPRATLPVATRRLVVERDAGRCQYCWRKIGPRTMFHIDHLIPVVVGGNNEADNLVVACIPCNQAKGANLGWRDECGHARFKRPYETLGDCPVCVKLARARPV